MKKLFLFIFISVSVLIAAQNDYQYLSPKPYSTDNTMETTIIIRQGENISQASLVNNAISVTGSKSGEVKGNLILSTDSKTLIFKPDQKFLPGEKVTVRLTGGIQTKSNKVLSKIEYSFSISPTSETLNPYEFIPELRPNFGNERSKNSSVSLDTPPDNFPGITTSIYDSNSIGDGYLFLSVSSDVPGIGYYLMMVDNAGNPFFYKELKDDYSYDFKMQQNGLLTYAQFIEHHSYTGGGNVIHKVMDNSFTVIDSVQMGNGYVAEAHDFIMLPNGHYLLFGYYLTQVDVSKFVEGGYPNALVSGGVVQELDEDKNVIFQWRSWDHYDFEDIVPFNRRPTAPIISEFHLNSIFPDVDGNLFIGTPRWTKKINRQTGEVMLNLGGDDNELSFIGVDSTDGVDHFGGHTFQRIENGHILLYDNGNRSGTKSSQVVEYILDEENKTAEFFWKFTPDSSIAGWHRGSAQRLPNGNTLVGWGGTSGKPAPVCTEVNEQGQVVFELHFESPDIESYRAFRFPFTDGAPAAEVYEIEVSTGNTYSFVQGDTLDTGIDVKINNMTGDGYNELIVTKYNYAPLNPVFVERGPIVLPRRIVLSNFAINSINAEIMFDVSKWGIKDPANSIVYFREFEGGGLFQPLPTSHNPVTGMLSATTTKFGEFIVTSADVESIVFVPKAYYPENYSTVNETLPTTLRWTPIGFISSYKLQVSTDSNFTSTIVNEPMLTDAFYALESLAANTTYYWRVKSVNDAGESDWTNTQSFTTTAPFVELTSPNGGEEFQRGLDYFITWEDNVDEDVILSLAASGTEQWESIDTTESTGGLSWSIDPQLPVGNYVIKIESITNNLLSDISNSEFAIVDTVTSVEENYLDYNYNLSQNFPNPFNPSTIINYSISAKSHVTLKVYDVLGNEIETLVNREQLSGNYNVSFNAASLSSGIYFYRITTDKFTKTNKMLLIK